MRKNSELATRQAESAAKAEREALLTKNAEQAQRLKELEANLLLGKQDAESAVGNESFSAGLPEIQQSLDQNSTEPKPLTGMSAPFVSPSRDRVRQSTAEPGSVTEGEFEHIDRSDSETSASPNIGVGYVPLCDKMYLYVYLYLLVHMS